MTLELKIIPLTQVAISASLMYTLAYYLPHLNYQLAFVPLTVSSILILAIIIGALALYDFHKHQTTYHPHTPEKTRKVVDSGIYALSRNPMYVALALSLIAFAIYLQNLSCLAIFPLFISYITRFQIIPEERMLNKLFPDEFPVYCQKVRRWL